MQSMCPVTGTQFDDNRTVAQMADLLEKCIVPGRGDIYRVLWVIKRVEGMTIPQATRHWASIDMKQPRLSVTLHCGNVCVTRANLPGLLQRLPESLGKTRALASVGALAGEQVMALTGEQLAGNSISNADGKLQRIVFDADGKTLEIPVRAPVVLAELCLGGHEFWNVPCC